MRLAVALGATLVAAAIGCRPKPVDQQALLMARDLGLTDLQRGRLPEAEEQFKKVVALAPRDPLGYANLGLTYLRGGRLAEAEAQLRRARRLDPASPEIGLITAKLYSLTGRSAEARGTLEEGGLRRDPRVLYALAELEGWNPDRLREVLALAPANLAVRLQLVDALVRQGGGGGRQTARSASWKRCAGFGPSRRGRPGRISPRRSIGCAPAGRRRRGRRSIASCTSWRSPRRTRRRWTT